MNNNFKVRWLKQKKDITINMDLYRKETNILFITGLVGSGKSTLAKELGKKYGARVVVQDYFGWSDKYDNEECSFFVGLFQKKYPETKDYFKNNEWRKNNLTREQKNEYRMKFDKMVVDYALENKNEIFIYEGSDLFCKSDINLMVDKPLIIKRTAALTSFIRNYKRGNINNDSFKKKIQYIKLKKYEFKRFYIQDLPKLNSFIEEINCKNSN